MALRHLERPQRQAYFDRVSRHLGAHEATVQIASRELGAQTAMDWISLKGLAYDPRSDEFEIITDEVDHHISHPQEIYVDDGVDGLHSVQVVDADGNKQIVRLREPLRLPAEGGPMG